MKTTLFIFCTVFSLNSLFAQLYVKDAYVFNKGSMIYVKDYVELNTINSNIFLRNEGQLLQGSSSVGGLNRGVGFLSVFQEGTANNYGYNYWCAPVGVPSAGAGNNSFVLDQVVKRPISNIAMQTPTFTSSYDGSSTSSALSISNRWIYKYTAANNYSNWTYVGQSGTVASGLGYTMKGVSGDDTTAIGETTVNNPTGAGGLNDYQRYDFRGKPNEGTIDISVAGLAGQYPNSTLTGNPYSSAINLNLFLLENSGYTVNYTTGAVSAGGPVDVINGNAYYWEHQKPATSHLLLQYLGGYGYYAPNNTNAFSPGTYNAGSWNTYNIDGSPNTTGSSTGSTYKRMFAPIGQGFMIEGKVNGNAQMKNLYRVFVKEGVASNSQFEKNTTTSNTIGIQNWDEIPNVAGVDYTQFSNAPTPQIKIHTTFNNQFTKEVTMAFNPNTTDGFDNAMDVGSYEANLTNDAYFAIPNNTKNFVITTLPFDINKRIPFTFKAGEQATFKVAVGDIINFNDAENVYLYDGLTGIYHDIKNGYFETTLPAGNYTNRFEVTFRDAALSISNPIKENITVVQNNTSHQLIISNPNMMEIKAVTLFDITGKLLFNKTKLAVKGSYEYSTASYADAVYLVKIQTSDGQSFGQKIIVSSK
ncbi:T9SS type A sorting domain-containing protein [Flavobacterium wongokense]|uniref:T9SS type A sorting domain-containing protein n=1 Tax=Flavobacterium wongokense TaxID=2910674 RepID=UPI001F40EF9C|nr:T9SS type A sorting domain-containing protein [Flavobacterium sp. WG47]MCF6130854.1 T9SS type A sorting domain-containing protein [Flavobacterium sp. WG47]